MMTTLWTELTLPQGVLLVGAAWVATWLITFVVDTARELLGKPSPAEPVLDAAELAEELRPFVVDLLNELGEAREIAEHNRDRDDRHAETVEQALATIVARAARPAS